MGLAAASVAASCASGSWKDSLVLIAGIGGLMSAGWGARAFVRALLRPPGREEFAALAEGRFPELAENLVTALEGGAFAQVCAARAIWMLAGRESELTRLEPEGAGRRRLSLLAVGIASLCLAVLLAHLSEGVPARPVETVEPAGPQAQQEGGRPEISPAVISSGRRARSWERAGNASAVLLAAPAGYERALELFLQEPRATGERR